MKFIKNYLTVILLLISIISLNAQVYDNGVNYNYYEGSFVTMPDFKGQIKVIKSDTIGSFVIPAQLSTSTFNNFALKFNAYIDITIAGNYTFYTSSDDGSILYINDTLVVSNNGIHGIIEKSGSVNLKPGKNLIEVNYFQATGGKFLSVSYSGPQLAKQVIPAFKLFKKNTEIEQLNKKLQVLNARIDSFIKIKMDTLVSVGSIKIKAGTSGKFIISNDSATVNQPGNITTYGIAQINNLATTYPLILNGFEKINSKINLTEVNYDKLLKEISAIKNANINSILLGYIENLNAQNKTNEQLILQLKKDLQDLKTKLSEGVLIKF